MPRRWNLQDAKARLSELVDRARAGEAQVILRRGEPAAVVIAFSDYEERDGPAQSVLSFFQDSPLKGLDVEAMPRRKERMREFG
ncbi:MAG TPA: type II toxin-antitoxin system Phd/YefM family antitoxin [Candidatus Baltobacteraceae bacterium]|nr:type II toxin-antitoxin system Phd/YefM family antitoxin [Candidatus Baltobacteraceae bacterium]